MAYTNGIYFIDLESGSDTARTALTAATVANPSGTITRCTYAGHGLVTGAVVDLTLFTAWLNSSWKITVVDANNFDLDDAVWQSTADNSGTVTPRGGSSMADAWLTISTGASAARIQPGDTIRIKATAAPTLVGDCAWTQYSKTVTLPGAVTANITDCETAWTASANVTSTADTSQFKENAKSARHVIAAGFTTGLAAYFATGTLNLSGYQQVSFWFRASLTISAGVFSVRLCSDTAGVTTVHNIGVPALPVANQWTVITVDLGANMNSAIASVALYVDADPGAATVYIDNILACKATSSADSLTLNSLLGKKWNFPWAAATTYAVGDTYRPTQPNRNGFCYRVTAQTSASGGTEPTWPVEIGATVVDGGVTWACQDLEDTWYGIQSINGTTVKLDNDPLTIGSAGRGYAGDTETVATYKRECFTPAIAGTNGELHGIADSGSLLGGQLTYSGGWNRTDMTTQTEETWTDGRNGNGRALDANAKTFLTFNNINAVRSLYGVFMDGASYSRVVNCHANNCVHGLYRSTGYYEVVGGSFRNSGSSGVTGSGPRTSLLRVAVSNGGVSGVISAASISADPISMHEIRAKNCGAYGLVPNLGTWRGSNVITGNCVTAPVDCNNAGTAKEHYFHNCTFPETFQSITALTDVKVYRTKVGQAADVHIINMDGGSIISATDQRHTASGISWKFLPVSVNRVDNYPLRMSVAKVAVAASAAVTMNIWTRRDSTQVSGLFIVRGGQIAGVPADVSVACAPSINTWTQSGSLTFTPTEAGVVEVEFWAWDGVGSTNAFWIDDFTVSQA